MGAISDGWILELILTADYVRQIRVLRTGLESGRVVSRPMARSDRDFGRILHLGSLEAGN
jgi:hypothetical protein